MSLSRDSIEELYGLIREYKSGALKAPEAILYGVSLLQSFTFRRCDTSPSDKDLSRYEDIYRETIELYKDGSLQAASDDFDEILYNSDKEDSVTLVCTDWIRGLVVQELEAKIRKRNTRRETAGCVEAGLVFYGCSELQAREAVAEWLGKSETYVRDSFYYFKSAYPLKSKEEFIETFWVNIVHIYENRKRDFPATFGKAFPAFEEMLKDANKKNLACDQKKPLFVDPYEDPLGRKNLPRQRKSA